MLGLCDQVGGHEVGAAGTVGNNDHLAGAGDRIDVDVAVDGFFGQRHEQVSRADDLVHRPDALDAVGQGRDGLCPADAINLADAQLVAGGQQVDVVGAERCGGRHHGQLAHASRLGRNGRHQHGRGIGRRAAGHADADPIERKVALLQVAAVRAGDFHVLGNQGALKLEDVVANAADRGQEGGIGLPVRGFEFGRRDAQGLGGDLRLVDAGRVVEHGFESLLADVAANTLDHCQRRKLLAEDFDRAPPPGLADHVAARAERGAEGRDSRAGVSLAAVDALDWKRYGRHMPWEYGLPFAGEGRHWQRSGRRATIIGPWLCSR